MRIRDVIAETEVGVMGVLALKTEGGHEPRSVSSFWKLERQGPGLPVEEGTSPSSSFMRPREARDRLLIPRTVIYF